MRCQLLEPAACRLQPREKGRLWRRMAAGCSTDRVELVGLTRREPRPSQLAFLDYFAILDVAFLFCCCCCCRCCCWRTCLHARARTL